MQIKIIPHTANRAASELLRLSRTIRHYKNETETAERLLRQMSEMEECCAALRKQKEALELITARLVHMSTALEEITTAYSTAEEKNLSRLEERSFSLRLPGNVTVYNTGTLRYKINQILHQ